MKEFKIKKLNVMGIIIKSCTLLVYPDGNCSIVFSPEEKEKFHYFLEFLENEVVFVENVSNEYVIRCKYDDIYVITY